jgi:hypothetical protein
MSKKQAPVAETDQSTLPLESPRASVPPTSVLVSVLGSSESRSLSGGVLVVGTSPEAGLRVADPRVSRTHVELRLNAEGVHVTDLGSKNGAFYLGRRFSEITVPLGSIIQIGETEIGLSVEARHSQSLAPLAITAYRGIQGQSLAMRTLFAYLEKLETSLVTVLIAGPSGVGKELVARAIHEGSTLAHVPMVTLNCGAIAPELVASELFGHKKGAFTGAIDTRIGAFGAADGGTLFLDEITELPLDLQSSGHCGKQSKLARRSSQGKFSRGSLLSPFGCTNGDRRAWRASR